MVPLLVIIVAAWFGYGSRRIRISEDKRNNQCKVIEGFNHKCDKLVCEVPPSLTKEDHISELPDDVLLNILARLSLREVSRISTISKRWKNMCLSLPFLNMDWRVMSGYNGHWHSERCKYYNTAYVQNVDQVLQQRKDQNILAFHLSFCLNYNKYARDIHRWIEFAAANKGLERLGLEFNCIDRCREPSKVCDHDEKYVVSDSWLRQFPYLKDLHLDTCILEFQSEFRLTNIISLNLSHVTLKGAEWQSIVSSLATVECLRIEWCSLPGKLCISENLECLSALSVYHCCGLEEVQFHAANLKTLDLRVSESVKCSFSGPLMLESLFVWFTRESEVTKARKMFSDLVQHTPCLKTLSLRADFAQMYKLPYCGTVSFGSILRLNLFMKEEDPEVDLVMNLCHMVKFFQQLETLVIRMPAIPRRDRYEPLAPSFFTKLKEVQLYQFSEPWIGFASFLLKSAINLDSMMLKSYSKFYNCFGDPHYFTSPFIKGESRRMSKALEGKAISRTAKVIVVNNMCKCYNENCIYSN